MALNFPLDFTTLNPKPSAVTFSAVSATATTQSPFTFQTQTFAHSGGRWQISVTLPPMLKATAEVWLARLVAMNGPQNTFYFGDPKNTTTQGVAADSSPIETPLINGASQTGTTVATDGWTPSTNFLLYWGDWIQFTGYTHLYKVMAAVNSNGSGEANIEIWPALHASPGDGVAVVYTATKGKWRLTGNQNIYAITPETYAVSFEAIEVID